MRHLPHKYINPLCVHNNTLVHVAIFIHVAGSPNELVAGCGTD